MSVDRELGDFYGNLIGAKADVFIADVGDTASLAARMKLDYMRQVLDDLPWLPIRHMWVAEAGLRLTY